MENPIQVIGKMIKVDEVTLHGLNRQFVRTLMEVDIWFPLPREFVLKDRDNDPIYVSYEKLFEVCFYYGRMRLEFHRCPQKFKDHKPSFLIDRLFKDEPRVFLANVLEVSARKNEVQEDIMICFPQAALFEDDPSDPIHGFADRGEPDQEGWKQVPFKKRSCVTKGRCGKSLRDNRTFKKVTRGAGLER